MFFIFQAIVVMAHIQSDNFVLVFFKSNLSNGFLFDRILSLWYGHKFS